MRRWRRGLALFASVLALVAGLLVFLNPYVLNHQTVALSPLVLGIGAAAVALWPGSGDWSKSRRIGAIVFALVWLVLSVPVLVNLIAVAGCACPASDGAGSAPPAMLGLETRYVSLVAMAVAWMALLVAAMLPARKESAGSATA